ncbi:protein FAR1-RELATED SEQUENCE 5-like [Oryza glaberrima]|uniref:protein FAR1-RELATED SEQUENCE 5-like n=1 Tax=Oryza glaberrima TaxID=4538 RepID=UPI00224C2F61|nr:protein FAR1-RELATED SEQUENCE 5-like [Oryza glaberrima]
MSSARSVASPSAAQVGGGSSARDVEQQKSAAAVGASSPVSSSKQHNLAKEENGTITANGDKQQKPAADRIVVEGEEDSDLLPISLSDPAILLPKIGQTFNEDSNGYAFYNLYARFTGFGIRRSKNRYKDGGVKSMQEFCCIREGRDNSVTGPPTRIGCKAMVRLNRSSESQKWRVSAFISEHNHEMKRDLQHTKHFRSHNFIDEGTKRNIKEMVDNGMTPTAMYGLLLAIFGCPLLREETIKAFKWLFQTFTNAMHGKRPATILTDNCHQMEVAIKAVWPETTHRVCKWHILKSAKENLGNIYSKRSSFKQEFHRVLNEPQTEAEFEKAWMSTTQRSESMNHVLKKYVKPSSSLHGFAKKYENFYNDRIEAEDGEEHDTYNEKVSTLTSLPIEKHASRVYTRGAFSRFKEQFKLSFSFMVYQTSDQHVLQLVHIGDDTLQSWGSKEFKVQVDLTEQDLSCGCKLFEYLGIICSHIIRVMVQYGFTEIPKKYILKRWTKDARDSIPKHLEESYLKDKEAASSRTYRNTLLHKSALDMVRLGGTSSETYEKTVEVLTKLIGELEVMCTSQVVNNKEIHCGDRTIGKKPTGVQLDDSVDSSDSEHGMPDDFCVSDEDGIGQDVSAGEDSVDVDMTNVNEEDILPPEVRRSRGRPRSTRLMSKGETSSKAKKKKASESTSKDESKNHAKGKKESTKQIRYCKQCGGHGHYKSTCGQKSSYERKK